MIKDQTKQPSELERLAPGLRRYARALVACDAVDPGSAADILTRDALQRAERAGRQSNVRIWLYATLTSFNRARSRSFDARAQGEATARENGVTDSLSAVPLDQRESLLLVVLEGFSYAEAADVLGLSRAAVGARVARARLILDERLDASCRAGERIKPSAPHLRLVK